MIETNASVHQAGRQAQLRARLAQAAVTLARQQAIKAVKRQLQARRSPQALADCASRDRRAGEEVIWPEHPELIAEAKPIVEQWRLEGFFGKRAAIQNPLREG